MATATISVTISVTLLDDGILVIRRHSEAPESDTHTAADTHSAGLLLFIADPSV